MTPNLEMRQPIFLKVTPLEAGGCAVATIAMEFLSLCHAPKSRCFYFWAASIAVVSYITVSNTAVAQFDLCFLFPVSYLLGQSEPYFLNTIPGISQVRAPTVES